MHPHAGPRSITLSWRAAALALLLPAAVHAQIGPARVDSLIRSMTLAEKVSLLHGESDPAGEGQAGYMPGVPRLGIPPLRLTDGPAGVRLALPATALPAPVALAASFDTALARRYGATMGREGRALGQDVLLAPMVNIVRVPQGGRDFETLGEDPFLASQIVAQEVRGIQSQGLIATVKHYVANNFEDGRTSVSADVGEQALHEIYLPGFEAAVAAGAGAVMCSYNRVNGHFACDDPETLTDILRGELRFTGWVMTDWGAHHSADALTAGLDQEMPGGRGSPRQPVYFGDSLVAAVRSGRVPELLVDRSVRRILTQMDRVGLLGGTIPPRLPLDTVVDAATARTVAVKGAVLLKNEGGVLPFSPTGLASVVVVGPTAVTPMVGGGGSAHVLPLDTEAALPALRRRAPSGVVVRYFPGIDLDGAAVPSAALATGAEKGASPGLARSEDGKSVGTDTVIDFTGAHALPAGHEWRWTGVLTAPATGDYAVKLQTQGGRASLDLDGEPVVGGRGGGGSLLATADGLSNATRVVHLEAGVGHAVSLALESGSRGGRGGAGTVQLRLAWVTPERRQAVLDQAVQAARNARAAVVFAHDEETEGVDRTSLSLPDDQDALIEALARANSQTVVVLQTGNAVLMPWIDDVSAVLETWYPGQSGGDATAALLLGQADPGGKLPVTFPRAASDAPTADSTRYPGVGGHAAYSEGILVGYRWYDAHDIAPLFPFGYGLSYTTFDYEDLDVRAAGDGLDVSFTVRNTGARPGTEVAQVYLGAPPNPPAPMTVKSLAGFRRVDLAAGESRRLTVHVDGRSLSYWSVTEHRWQRALGARPVLVGSSSRDIRLRGSADVGDGTAG
jgi:beta-glucosidase